MRTTDSGLVLAPVILRLLALLIDGAIMTVAGLAVTASLGDTAIKQRDTYAVLVVLVAVYNIAFLVAKSATPGKMLMGLYVADPQGQPLTPDRAILRYVVFFIGGAVFGIGTIASLVLMIVDKQRRTIHDRVAGTIVIAGRPGAPLKPQ